MKKKLLLLIILLIPFIVSAEQVVLEGEIGRRIDDYFDNDSSYVITAGETMHVIEKETGTKYSKKFNDAYDLRWFNYDYENMKFSEKPSSHYIVVDNSNEKIYLLDNKLNVIKKSDGFYEEVYEFYIKDNEINFLCTSGNNIYLYTYDKDLNYKRETSLLVEESSWVSPYYDEQKGIIRDLDIELTYTFDEENNLIKSAPEKFIYKDYGYLVLHDAIENMDIKEKELTNDDIISGFQYGDYYYVLYINNRGNLILASYDMELNLVKEKNLKSEYNININYIKDVYMFVVNNKIYVDCRYMSNQEIFFEVDEELNLTKKTVVEALKSNLYYIENSGRALESINPYSIDIVKFQKSIRKIENLFYDMEMSELAYSFSNIKQVNNKLYAFIPNVEFINNDEEMKLTGYLYVYNEEDKLEKKTLITTLTINEEEFESIRDVLNGLTYIDNKLIYYQQIMTEEPKDKFSNKYIEVDLSGNIIGEIEEPESFENLYTYASYTLSGNYELLIQANERYSINSPRTSTTTKTKDPVNRSNRNKNVAGSSSARLSMKLISNKIDITINSPEGEAILSDTTPGKEVIITVTPKEGYEVKEIKITTKSGKVITVTDNKFIMPNEDFTIDVIYESKSIFEEIVDNPYTLDTIILVISISIISFVAFIYNKKKTVYLK